MAETHGERTKAVEAWVGELKLYLEGAEAMSLYSARIADQFDEFNYRKEIRKLDVMERTLKNHILQNEAKMSDLEFRRILKEWEANDDGAV